MGALGSLYADLAGFRALLNKPKAAPPPPTPPHTPTPAPPPTPPTPPSYEPGNAPPPPDPNALSPYGSLPSGWGSDGSAASSGNPGQAMPPNDPYVSSPDYGPNYGYVGSGDQSFSGYGPSAVNALNDAFVASGLGNNNNKDQSGNALSGGMGGIGSDWVSGGSVGADGSNWDPQGIAAKIASGSPDIPPALAASNLARYAAAFQNFGGFKNPNAGFAASTVAGAESGGNPYAVNQGGSGATGMNQWMNTSGNPRLTNMQNLTAGNISPETEAAFAASEILGGGYPGVYNALNNPNAGLTGMQGQLINQFEGLGGYPSQAAIDRVNAAKYAQTQSAFLTALKNNVTQNAGMSPQ